MSQVPDDHVPWSPGISPHELLRVGAVESPHGVLVLTPVGEVDLASADVFREALRRAVAAGPRSIVVDLSGLRLCGSTGLVVLMKARWEAEAAGVRFGTADGPSIVRRVLAITQLGPALNHRESLAEALRDFTR